MKRIFTRRSVFVVATALIIAAAGFWYYSTQMAAKTALPAPTIKTAKVRTGDLVISVNGPGTLIASQEANLGFRTPGRLTEISVQVGDAVKSGQSLARLDETDAKAQVAQSEIALKTAELKLAELKRPPSPQAVASAQENLASAKAAQNDLLAGATESEVALAKADMKLAEIGLQVAQGAYDKIASRPDAGATSQAMSLWQATVSFEKARAVYEGKVAPPSQELVAAARAKVASAQAQLDALLAGPTSEDVQAAQLAIEQAKNNLTTARQQLESATLKAPFAGTVTLVKANVGELVGTTAIISLAAIQEPLVRFTIEESDVASLAPGMSVQVTFGALPDDPFTGKVSRISPVLFVVDGVPSAETIAQLDANPKRLVLRVGMSADVEVTASSAKGVLIVPIEALRELGVNQYGVFVVKSDGQLELRPVVVGLRDFANAEIVSGLQKGETVSTGASATE